MKRVKVLIIAPHPDDEVLGCGGAARLRVEAGDTVSVVFLTSGELGLKHLRHERAWAIREAEARRAARILGFGKLFFLRQPDWQLEDHLQSSAAALRSVLRKVNPGVIYLPHPGDGHPDHQATLPLLQLSLAKPQRAETELLGYEVWTPITQPEIIVDISKVMSRKLRALRAHRSQLVEFNYARAISGLNQYRGASCAQCSFAEVFRRLELQ